jgi:hypothetical protein
MTDFTVSTAPHMDDTVLASRGFLKQQLVSRLASGDTAGAHQVSALLRAAGKPAPVTDSRECSAVTLLDGHVVEAVEMTATPEAAVFFAGLPAED